jgi:excisionase family DNA binding protein
MEQPRNRAERRLLASNRYKYGPLGFSVQETAARLNSSKSTVYRLLRRGQLRAKKRGASTLVIPESIDEYEAALPDAVFASEEIATAA